MSYLLERERYIKNTITVEELIKILESYPKTMRVFTTLESTIHALQAKNIYTSETESLYLDADENFYKKDFAKNPEENE